MTSRRIHPNAVYFFYWRGILLFYWRTCHECVREAAGTLRCGDCYVAVRRMIPKELESHDYYSGAKNAMLIGNEAQ